MRISKNPEDYRYSPPPERTETAVRALTVLFVVAMSIPAILDATRNGWDLGVLSLKAISLGVLTILARRVLPLIVDRASRWARSRWRGVPWEPSKNPDDYR
jgi:hypothetical protein